MADVFISYKREDRASAERLSQALESLGFDVWWDMDLLSGERYRKAIRAVIDQCAATVVLWSRTSVDSDFVLDEAEHAKSQGKLFPGRIADVKPPMGFGQIHADDLISWDGELTHPGFQRLVKALEDRIGRKGRLASGQQRSAQSQAASSELEAFKAAQVANNVSALKTFLRNYPRGAFAAFVRGQIETMEPGGAGPAPSASGHPAYASAGAPRGAAWEADQAPPMRKPPLPWIIGGAAAVVLTLALLGYVGVNEINRARDVKERQERDALMAQMRELEAKAMAREAAVQMAGDWRRVTGSDCAAGYRIGFARGVLTRAVPTGSGWGPPRAATRVIDASTVAFGDTQLRVDQDRMNVSNTEWGEGCEFVRGAPQAIIDDMPTTGVWRNMVGDWQRVSGANCDRGYRIALSGDSLTRAFTSGSSWGTPSAASTVVNDNTVAFADTHLRYSGGRIYVSNASWTSGCEFIRGAPPPPAATWRRMVGDWQRVSGTNCDRGYRIGLSGDSLTRAFTSTSSSSGWGTPSTASSVVNDTTVAWGTTHLRYSGGRIYVSNTSWSSGCEFTRGAPSRTPTTTASSSSASTALWRNMVGDWRRVSGTMCSRGYRIAYSGNSLSRAFHLTSGWGTPATATSIVNDSTIAWGTTRLRYSGGRIYVSDSTWSSGCEFIRGAPTTSSSSSSSSSASATWRNMVGDWRRVSGTSCVEGYRIGLSGDSLTRAFSSGSTWGTPSTSSGIINDSTVAWGNTHLRYSGGRIYVSNSSWSSGCEFVRGVPSSMSSSSSSSTSAAWRNMVGDWRRVSGTMCSTGYRIELSGGSLSRAFASGSSWGSPSNASSIVNDSTIAWGSTQLRYSGGRIYVSDSNWSSGCEFVRGAPASGTSSSSSSSTSGAWRNMVGDWQRVSGTMCSRGYRIAYSGGSLSRAFFSDPSWGTPATASSIVNDSTVAWGTTQLRYSGGRIYVTDSGWSSGCEFTRGAPTSTSSSASSAGTQAWRSMVGDWRRVSGTMCSTGYRIGLSGGALTRAFRSGSGWGSPATASSVVNANTVAWGSTRLRYSGGRIYVTDSNWSTGCEFVRGSP